MFEEKVQIIEKQLEDSNDVSSFLKIGTQIEEIKYEIKKILFSKQTIVFFNNFDGNLGKPLLVIVENEYLKSLEQFKSKLDLEIKKNMNLDENIFEDILLQYSRNWNDDHPIRVKHYSGSRVLDQSLQVELKSLEQFRYTTTYADAFHGLNTLGIRNSLGVFKSINTDTYKNKDLPKKTIKDVNIKALDGMSQLKELNLAENEFKLIHDFAFKKLQNLTNLCLQNNSISQISENMLKGLFSLKELNISSNQIKLIENNSFLDLSKLEKLNLSNNEIFQINENTLKGLFSLKDLELTNNSIHLIEDNSFSFLNELIYLDLKLNNLVKINQNTFNGLKKLEKLNLRDNKNLSSIDDLSFLDLSELLYLDFWGDSINQINLKKNLFN